MRYVIADAYEGLDKGFHLVEHAVDYYGKSGQGIVGLAMREAFTQVARNDALYPLVDLNDTTPGASVQHHTNGKAKKHSRNQNKRDRYTLNESDLPDLIDVSPDRQYVAVRQLSCDQADGLFLPASFVDPVDHHALYFIIDFQARRQRFEVARQPAAA
jgi:hypothetical protein